MSEEKINESIESTAASNAPTIDEIKQINARVNRIEQRVEDLQKDQNAIVNVTAEWILDTINSTVARNNDEQILLKTEKLLLKENTKILSEIGRYEENWNGYGAERIDQRIIFKALDVITSLELKYQPDIFPTARGSIQLEYELSETHYFEIEISLDKYIIYQRINENTMTQHISDDAILFKLIDEFNVKCRNI